MSKIQVDSNCPSSATHRQTQASTTLNRRYVHRPSNLAIEEAARSATFNTEDATPAAPSRLVNLRVHAAELEAARLREAEEVAARAENEALSSQIAIYPDVVEFGTAPETPMTTEINAAPTTPEANLIPQNSMSMTPIVEPTPESTLVSKPTPVAPTSIDTDTLAMNIAADYAAANLSASIKEYGDNYQDYAITAPAEPAASATPTSVLNFLDPTTDSVDAIARAASEAIATIRVATEPAEVSEQVASLKAFAEGIKNNPSLPEMKELGDTIEKFVNIAMKSTKVQEETKKKATAKVTLSPKVNRAAAKVTKSSAKIMANNRAKSPMTARPAMKSRTISRQEMMTSSIRMSRPSAAMRRPAAAKRSLSPQELKNRAIEQALESVATMDEPNRKKATRQPAMRTRRKGSGKRFAIAFACAAICVAGVITFVSANIPDISLRVTAMQTGINAAYPAYVPRDYNLGDIRSENGKISMTFNGPDGASFILDEEKSSWDSATLERNYVIPTWGEEYTTTHEQGITIYISNVNSDAAWVNSGTLYKITSSGTALTKKQVRNIVVSL